MQMMTRPWTCLLVAALLLVGGCSDDDENTPPTVDLLFPDDGYRFDGSTDEVVLLVQDNGNVAVVEVTLDAEVVATVRDSKGELNIELPVGRWADGLDHVLDARALDVEGAEGEVAAITISIDPTLQTVPQIVAVAPGPDAPDQLRLEWLDHPGATGYRYEVARTDGFSQLLVSGETGDRTVDLPDLDTSLLYARVRATVDGTETGWSRTFRYDGTTGWREVYELPNRQMGTAVLTAPDGSLRLLSHAVREARVAGAQVQLLEVTADGELLAAHDLLDATYWPTSHLLVDQTLLLTGLRTDGRGFIAGFDLEGGAVFVDEPGDHLTTALWRDPGGEVRLAGTDLREGTSGGVMHTLDASSGATTELVTFELETGREVLAGWPRSDAGWVVAGQLPDEAEDVYGGVFARGLAADGTTDWNLRVGAADRWLMRGHGADGQGQYVLTGIAFRADPARRYAFLVNFDHRGRLRWQIGESRWHHYTDVEPTLDGRWTAVGARRRSVTSETWLYDTALRGFSNAGLPLFENQHGLGVESQGWGLAPHPDGGWYVTGFTTADRNEYQADLLRVDDLGELD